MRRDRQQKGFGAGDLADVVPVDDGDEPAVAMVLGVLLLGAEPQASVPTALFLGIILAVMVRAVIELAKTLCGARLGKRRAQARRARLRRPTVRSVVNCSDRVDDRRYGRRPFLGLLVVVIADELSWRQCSPPGIAPRSGQHLGDDLAATVEGLA